MPKLEPSVKSSEYTTLKLTVKLPPTKGSLVLRNLILTQNAVSLAGILAAGGSASIWLWQSMLFSIPALFLSSTASKPRLETIEVVQNSMTKSLELI
jgi:hypothetical protein